MTVNVWAAPTLCAIPGGEYRMGDDSGRLDERPAHLVRVQPFLLARFPVTNSQYGQYLVALGAQAAGDKPRPYGTTGDPAGPPTRTAGELEPRFWHDARFNAPEQPVVGVNWFEAVAYCTWLSRELGQACRLPTEAEREWASFGGLSSVKYPWGDAEPELVGPWARGARGQDRPVAMGAESALNGFGLGHMADNVHEWCADWYAPDYSAALDIDDPRGPTTGSRRASRGGAWRHELKFSRCASRSSLPPHLRYNDYGFRVAADV